MKYYMNFSKKILKAINEGVYNALSFDDELPDTEDITMHKISNTSVSKDRHTNLRLSIYVRMFEEIGFLTKKLVIWEKQTHHSTYDNVNYSYEIQGNKIIIKGSATSSSPLYGPINDITIAMVEFLNDDTVTIYYNQYVRDNFSIANFATNDIIGQISKCIEDFNDDNPTYKIKKLDTIYLVEKVNNPFVNEIRYSHCLGEPALSGEFLFPNKVKVVECEDPSYMEKCTNFKDNTHDNQLVYVWDDAFLFNNLGNISKEELQKVISFFGKQGFYNVDVHNVLPHELYIQENVYNEEFDPEGSVELLKSIKYKYHSNWFDFKWGHNADLTYSYKQNKEGYIYNAFGTDKVIAAIRKGKNPAMNLFLQATTKFINELIDNRLPCDIPYIYDRLTNANKYNNIYYTYINEFNYGTYINGFYNNETLNNFTKITGLTMEDMLKITYAIYTILRTGKLEEFV